MYEEHPTFIQPDNEEIKVWRYIDFTKLVSLIDSCKLYSYEGTYEGTVVRD